MNPQEVQDAIAARRGHRGWFTQAIRHVEHLGATAQGPPLNTTQLMYDRLTDGAEVLRTRYMKLNECLQLIRDGDVRQDRRQANDDDITQEEGRYNAAMDIVFNALRNFNQPAVVQANVPGQVQGNLIKPVQDLKPYTLTFEHTPTELRDWITRFNSYMEASRITTQPNVQQQAFMRQNVSPAVWSVVKQRINDATPVYGQDPNVVTCISVLNTQFEVRYPIIMRRFEFFRYEQQKNQPYSDYYAKLRDLAATARMEEMQEDDFIIYRIITGVREASVRDKLLSIPAANFNLEEVDRIARVCEAACAFKQMSVEKANSAKSGNSKQKQNRKNSDWQKKFQWLKKHNKCTRCAKPTHGRGENCPAIDKECKSCNKKGHFTPACAGTPIPKVSRAASRSSTRSSSPTHQGNSDKTNFVRKIGSRASPRHSVVFKPTVGQEFSFPVLSDSGATRTIFAYNLLRQYGIPVEESDNEALYNASGDNMNVKGKIRIDAIFQGTRHTVDALVSNSFKDEVLLSWHDSEALRTLQIARIVSQDFVEHKLQVLKTKYSSVLSDTLTERPMKGPPMTINLRKDLPIVPHRIYTSPQVPIHFKKEAERTIQDALDKKIIEEVPSSESSEWISRGFFVPKPDGKRLRLVVDFSPLNRFVERPVHPFIAGAELVKNIDPESKVFCKLDATMGYYQIPLQEDSRKLTTFLLHNGRYRFCRAPMGLSSSSDLFCKRTDDALKNLPGTMKLVDDILIEAPDYEILFSRLEAVLQRCEEHNIVLSLSKLAIGDSVPFSGYTVSAKGVLPSPERTEAIRNFPVPTNVTGLRSFLGLANQLGRFIPDLAHLTDPLRQMLKKDVSWHWCQDHEDAFQNVKSALTGPLLVKPFDPKLSTELVTDASRIGVGFALFQHSRDGQLNLIECGSRSLSGAESRYAVCELEGLAILYAISKCKHFLLGMPNFTVITDHRPLLGIFAKDIPSIQNPRLRRIREKLGEYNFQIEWREGKLHCIADALSRFPVLPALEEDQDMCLAVQEDPKMLHLAELASQDQEYQSLIKSLQTFTDVKDLDASDPARKYCTVWDRLQIHPTLNLVLLDNDRIVIPASAKKTILEELHIPHCGVSKTRYQAKSLYYWPHMNLDIKNLVEGCVICREYLPSKPAHRKIENKGDDSTLLPMEALGADLFSFEGQNYLVVVDRGSGFPWCFKLRTLVTSAVLKQFVEIFNTFGWPQRLRTDGGPQFRTEFKDFCVKNGIIHELSSPYFSSSNGLAESAVKQVKYLLGKCGGNWSAFQTALFEWRNCASPYRQNSPNELFFRRQVRGKLPKLPQLQKESNEPSCEDKDQDHDCFQIGDRVVIQDPISKKWNETGEVVSIRSSRHSFFIRTSNDREILRNCKFLRRISADSAKRVSFNI